MLVEPMDIPGSGRMCIAQDPQGAAFGVWQAAGMHGAELYAEPGSLVWTDIRIPDPDAGGTILAEPFDTPYGRMAGITDPNGAVFFVVGMMPPA